MSHLLDLLLPLVCDKILLMRSYMSNGNPFQNPGRSGGNHHHSHQQGKPGFELRMRLRRWRYDWNHGGRNITLVLIAICTLIWLIEEIAYFINPQALRVAEIPFELVPSFVSSHPWTMLTSIFLHSVPGITHIFFNMVSLYIGGIVLEKLLGHWEFLALFLISGFGGSVSYMIWWKQTDPSALVAVIGASGAIFGLFGASLVASAKMRMETNALSLAIFLGLTLIVPMLFSTVAWQVHLGGFVTGTLLAWLMTSGLPALRSASIGRRMWIYGGSVSAILLVVFLICLVN